MKLSIQEKCNEELIEWIESFEGLIENTDQETAISILDALDRKAKEAGLINEASKYSPYQNSISVDQQSKFPGNLEIEEKITAILRWNAQAMVMRANKAYGELGGHIASYASAAEVFEVGFNHFFRGGDDGDLVYFQPHSAPGVYARAFLEGRLDESQLSKYRQETHGGGLCSYPHPWLMPDFWQFPSGSMGLGPINAVYNARFMRYLHSRKLADTSKKHVWGVFGDGEMDEPESIGGLSIAAREKLDNLTFIINCNLQRLDGPVRGNGQIIPELESIFQGAGWNVIKVLWGSEWDELFARDTNRALLRCFSETVDGKYQTLGANDGEYNLKHFFDEDPEVMKLVAHMSDQQINDLKRGGHDFRKLYAAFEKAKNSKGKPTVILVKTKKGYGMGAAGESKMTAHQAKKLDQQGLLEFRDRFSLPLSDEEVKELKFYRPDESSEEIQYLKAKRAALGGYLPKRSHAFNPIPIPALDTFGKFALGENIKGASTTMAFVRMLGGLLKDKHIGPRIVPIVADEARTFGMANLFKQIGIYAPEGQLYEPEDSSSLLNYKEQKDGQLLEEGINEAGALASWTAAATSYSTHNVPMLPIYIYYSMFGFQRVGDLIWAASDQRSRGFLIGATAGRTTLSGEGLQHQDGTSQLIASTVPNCKSYDPCYAHELAIIFREGSKRMMEDNKDEFYYITVMNENYPQPGVQQHLSDNIEHDIMQGMYHMSAQGKPNADLHVQLLGSGTILREVESAAVLLQDDFGVSSDIWSVTSFNELARDGQETERQKRLNPRIESLSHVQTCLQNQAGPVIAATDYVKQYADQIATYIKQPYYVLGTDGFGRSDTRINLRNFFEVDRYHIAITALQGLFEMGHIKIETLEEAVKKYRIDNNKPNPRTV